MSESMKLFLFKVFMYFILICGIFSLSIHYINLLWIYLYGSTLLDPSTTISNIATRVCVSGATGFAIISLWEMSEIKKSGDENIKKKYEDSIASLDKALKALEEAIKRV